MGVSRYRPNQARIEEYWDWMAVALFLLTTVDLITTFYAARRFGPGAEANPLMAWLLSQPMSTITAVHLGVVVLVLALFSAIVAAFRTAPSPYDRYLGRGIELWLGLLCAGGLFVFANNLVVIFFGRSLL